MNSNGNKEFFSQLSTIITLFSIAIMFLLALILFLTQENLDYFLHSKMASAERVENTFIPRKVGVQIGPQHFTSCM